MAVIKRSQTLVKVLTSGCFLVQYYLVSRKTVTKPYSCQNKFLPLICVNLLKHEIEFAIYCKKVSSSIIGSSQYIKIQTVVFFPFLLRKFLLLLIRDSFSLFRRSSDLNVRKAQLPCLSVKHNLNYLMSCHLRLQKFLVYKKVFRNKKPSHFYFLGRVVFKKRHNFESVCAAAPV